MRAKQLVAAALVAALLFGRPAAVDAGWAGMLVQVAAMLSQIRAQVSTAEAYVAQAQAEARGLLDPGGLVSSVGSLADWRSLLLGADRPRAVVAAVHRVAGAGQ